MPVRLAILGDFQPGMHTHVPLAPALASAGAPQLVTAEWIATSQANLETLAGYDGIVLAPGSPYANFAGVLAAIRQARLNAQPFLGICGGFQHALIEFARHELQLPGADSAEHGGPSRHLVIVPVGCRLDGRYEVEILPGTRLAGCYAAPGGNAGGNAEVFEETYFCGFQANRDYESDFARAGLVINARALDGVPRGCELPAHPFFLATAFQPQMRPGHPVLRAFVQAARYRALRRTWVEIRDDDYQAHMLSTGQARTNAALSAELLAPFAGRKLLVAGAGPAQAAGFGLALDPARTTLTDIHPGFLAAAAARWPGCRALVHDITQPMDDTFDVVLSVLVLEHVDWRRALAALSQCAPDWLFVLQRNPKGMSTAVTPGTLPPGSMQALALDVRPHLVDEAGLLAEARRLGYQPVRQIERPVLDGKAMVGYHFRRT